MTREVWVRCLLILRASYATSMKLDDAGAEVWFEMLKDLPGEKVVAAVMHMCKTTKAFPSIAEIREHALGDEGKPDHTRAWGEFVEAIRRVGYMGKPEFSDPALVETVKRLGGWSHICTTMLVEHEPTWRAQFRAAYTDAHAALSRSKTFEGLLLPGATDKPLLGDGGRG